MLPNWKCSVGVYWHGIIPRKKKRKKKKRGKRKKKKKRKRKGETKIASGDRNRTIPRVTHGAI